MDRDIYDKSVLCPVCKKEFKTKKVRTSAIRVEKRDTDFCVYYKGICPYFYDVWVCPVCGYAATENKFLSIRPREKEKVQELITPKWKARTYGGERTIQDAILCYKLALHEGMVIEKEKSYIGGICLKLAWLYRYLQDEPREKEFLKFAKDNIEMAFSKERFPILGMDEASINFLVGEICLRLHEYQDAIRWFSFALKSPGIKSKAILERTLRDRWQDASAEYKKIKGETDEELLQQV